MFKKTRSSKIIILFTILVFSLVFVAMGSFWLARGGLTQQKISILKSAPFFIASIGSKPIIFKDFWNYYELYAKNSSKDITSYQEIFNSFAESQKTLVVLDQLKISIGKNEISEFSNYLEQNSGDKKKLNSEVVLQYLSEYKLRTWYNAEPDLNKKEYDLLEDIKNQLLQKQNFAKLANIYSQDEASKNFGGDLGFVNTNEVMPELRDAINSMNPGDYKIVASNLGVHLFYLEKNLLNDNTKHLKQIFLKTSGFESWLIKQKAQVSVKQYITL
jgi:hypothetical protein